MNRPRFLVASLAASALAGILLFPAAPSAAAARAPFDPAGALLEGKEKIPGFGKAEFTLHLGADGSAAGDFLDPQALAVGWTGTWTWNAGDALLELDLAPLFPGADDILVSLKMKGNGKGKGTVERNGVSDILTKVKVKALHPAPKPKGWTAVVPRLRNGAATSAGSFRGTLVLRSLLAQEGKKPKPLSLTIRAVGASGMPGGSRDVELLPRTALVLAGPEIPGLPNGITEPAVQLVITSRKKKGFDPSSVMLSVVEEVLRGPTNPATSGGPVPVRWVRPLSKKEAVAREAAPLVAPRFLDDGGAGGTPRETELVLRDLSPFTKDAAVGSVRVSVRTLAGVEVAAEDVDLPRGAAVTVRPLDLLDVPGDLPSGEGQIRVTLPDGSGIPRGLVGAALSSTVRSGATPIATLFPTLEAPEPAGRSARLAVPYVYAPGDASAETRISVLNLGSSSTSLDVTVAKLAGDVLHTASVPSAAGETVRVDPAALGMDLGLLPGGEAQVTVGGSGGVPVERFLADGEARFGGTPDTLFPGPVTFERDAGGDTVTVHLLDALETQGSDAGDRDGWLFFRNGGPTSADLLLRAYSGDDVPLGITGSTPVQVPAGASLRVSLEEALIALGVPVDGSSNFRISVELEGVPPGPFAVEALQLRRSALATGGYVAPVTILP